MSRGGGAARPARRPSRSRAPSRDTTRTGPRTTSAGRRPAGPRRRLLRQRLIVFVVVTLLVALGIALVQGCQGQARSMGVPERSTYASGPPDAAHRTAGTPGPGGTPGPARSAGPGAQSVAEEPPPLATA
ncbi:hypothetical protein [Streptomyces sp. GC420]|uniref:hypothetical protein n=1 Tax=Streptomyces sp. GC420 TaxID=2697568 RepID=UPI0037DA16D2